MNEQTPLKGGELSFENTALAFQAKTDKQLWKTYRLFQLIDSPFLTKIGPPLLSKAIKWNLPIESIVKNTLFELFCGGVSISDTLSTTEELANYGVKTILDFSVEGELNELGFEKTKNEIIQTLIHGGKYSDVCFSACKVTGLGNFSLLEKIHQKNELSKREEIEWNQLKKRIDLICAEAVKQKTPILIDAEESWIQNPVDQLAEEMMEKYNVDSAYVFTTIQCYRWDRLDYLKELIARSGNKAFYLGIKLVRGAYLEKETKRAKELGYTNPMQPSLVATHKDYNQALALCIKYLEHVHLFAGTHNEYSSKYLTELMSRAGVLSNDNRVWFAQLLGMSDHISFNLAHRRYNVAKYVPYGPVKAVVPYLMRRAQENTAIAGQSSREVELLKKEIIRRRKKIG